MSSGFQNWTPGAGSFSGFTAAQGSNKFQNWALSPGSLSAFKAAIGGHSETVPGAPTGVAAVNGNANAVVTWTPPGSTGGTPITGYLVTSSPATTTQALASGGTFTGLTNGTAYTFTVQAVNAVGTGPASSASNSITAGVPAAPTAVAGTSAVDSASVITWTDGSNNGSAVTSYNVVSNPATTTQHFSSGGTFTGLTNGTSYTFTVQAVNANGAGATSAASASVTPSTVPAAPTIGTAVAGDTTATVSWTDNGTGGSAITSHNIVSSPATTTQHFSSGGTFTGLSNGTAYTFTVQAVNANGASASSSASNSVTPQPSFTPPTNVTFTSTVLTNGAWSGDPTPTQNVTGPQSQTGWTVAISGFNVHRLAGTLTGASTTFQMICKAGTLGFVGFNDPNTGQNAGFDLTGGTVFSHSGSCTATIVTAGSGWWLIKCVIPSTAGPVRFIPADTGANSTLGGAFSATGNILMCNAAAT